MIFLEINEYLNVSRHTNTMVATLDPTRGTNVNVRFLNLLKVGCIFAYSFSVARFLDRDETVDNTLRRNQPNP